MRRLFVAAALASFLGACSTTQIESSAATIEGDIQAGAAALCGIVPTIGTILSVVGAVTGTTEITTLAGVGVTAIESDICSAAPATSSARYKALPLRSVAPATIGVEPHGVAVTGWRAG
jgi:hypothetical protein